MQRWISWFGGHGGERGSDFSRREKGSADLRVIDVDSPPQIGRSGDGEEAECGRRRDVGGAEAPRSLAARSDRDRAPAIGQKEMKKNSGAHSWQSK